MSKETPFRCHDADACAMGQSACPTPSICGCAAPACAVKEGTHKPTQALHNISEPRPKALHLSLMMDLMSKEPSMGHEIDIRRQHCREAAAMLSTQHAHIAELEDMLRKEVQHSAGLAAIKAAPAAQAVEPVTYPHLPKHCATQYDDIDQEDVRLFSEHQMRAYVDSDRAQRAAPAPAAVAVPDGWREQFASDVYADLAAADNQDIPLEDYPARILKVLDSIVGPRHPVVIKWRNDAIQNCIAIAYKYCRDPESHKYLRQDLEAMLAANQPAQAQDVQRDVPKLQLLAADHKGMRVDYSGLLGQVQREIGRSAPGHAEMIRQLRGHMQELGQRWYAGQPEAVDEFLQLYCVEREARAAIAASAAKGGEA